MATRTPASHRNSRARALKSLWKVSGKRVPLKRFAQSLAMGSGESRDIAADWLFNKRANFSKPPQGIGRTRQRVKSGGNKGQQVKKLDGK